MIHFYVLKYVGNSLNVSSAAQHKEHACFIKVGLKCKGYLTRFFNVSQIQRKKWQNVTGLRSYFFSVLEGVALPVLARFSSNVRFSILFPCFSKFFGCIQNIYKRTVYSGWAD